MSEDKKECFVIMPISDAEGYDKGHFTRVYEHLVKPAVIEAGFEPMRADDTSKANCGGHIKTDTRIRYGYM